jgi:hypothetical protein
VAAPRLPLSTAGALKALALLAACAAPLGAAGTTAAEFLTDRTSARAAGMGEAYGALGADITALAYQPAAVAGIRGPSVSFLHYAQVEGVSLEDVAYAQPLDLGTLFGSVIYRGQPDINNTYATDAPVSAWDLAVSAGWAGRLSKYMDWLPALLQEADGGATLKYISSQLGRYNAWTLAADLGLKAPLGEGITGSLALLDAGPGMTFIAVTDPLPTTLTGGLSRSFDPLWGNQVNLSAELELPYQGDMRLHLGLEDWLGTALALRAGYILGTGQSLSGLTLGMGVKLDQEGLLFNLDYAVRPLYYDGFNSYDNQQLFQISLMF